ncbi:MAG: hypothetical protein IJW54_03730 [Clostridia bacterium]|nr:hypothetical protein [Clostridia bacterium]
MCNVLILSVVNEYSDSELIQIGKEINDSCLVFSGNGHKIEKLLNRKVIDYSKDSYFLQKNAELTAEATITLIYNHTQKSLDGQRVLVAGYGRIGKALCKILDFFGSKVYVYARRKEIQDEINAHGYKSVSLDDLTYDIILNTIPSIIFTNEMMKNIPNNSVLIELASKPGGFGDEKGVIDGGRLPGRILPKSASKIIFDTIIKGFPCEKG